MTNEEIEKIARLFLAHPQFPNLAREVVSGDDRRGVAVLSEVLREAVAQAYEEAARKMCLYCEADEPLAMGNTGRWYHPLPTLLRVAQDMPCLAWEIHTLKDSLIGETVP